VQETRQRSFIKSAGMHELADDAAQRLHRSGHDRTPEHERHLQAAQSLAQLRFRLRTEPLNATGSAD
jgi:hypothetical protein